MIQINDLNYRVRNRDILLNINLTIKKGEFAAIIGPNGAGKSTLLKIILGLTRGYSGEVFIEGKKNSIWLRNKIIGYLPQKEEFDRGFPATVLDIALMGIAGKKGLFNAFLKADKEKAIEKLKLVGMDSLRNQYIGSLSGGEFQKVLLARALIGGSDYLFLDEPEAGVDRESIESFYRLLLKLNKAGKTILIVSHDISVIPRYCEFLICLNKTLHCHTKSELVNSEIIKKTYGDVVKIIEKI